MATFTIDATTATFTATIANSQDEAGDLERLSLSIYVDNEIDWGALYALVTTKYHVHVPIGGSDVVVDIARGLGVGTLTVDGLMTASAILVALSRSRWLPGSRMTGTAQFLITEIL
jgi:hypothetical protein